MPSRALLPPLRPDRFCRERECGAILQPNEPGPRCDCCIRLAGDDVEPEAKLCFYCDAALKASERGICGECWAKTPAQRRGARDRQLGQALRLVQ